MRHDFQKLLCECYKEGRKWATSSGTVRRRLKRIHNEEDGYSTASISPSKIRDTEKSFGENLAPLKRYINKQVGRPWNKVYSDICSHNSKTGAVGLHIFQHLYWYIDTEVKKDEHKRIYRKSGCEHRYGSENEISFGCLYVDPDDNIIKRYRKNKRKQKPANQKQSIRIDALHTIEKDNGIWHAYTWKETPRHLQQRERRRGTALYYNEVYCLRRKTAARFPAAKVYAVKKRQLDKRELQKHNIKNESQF